MTRAFSLYLDLLRAVAALSVVIFHLADPRFTVVTYQVVREMDLGRDAVILFFVISGFVIAFCADTKDKTISGFAFARLTRLISVALPALVLGFLLDAYGASSFESFYETRFYNAIPFNEQLFRGVTFSNEWVWSPIRLGTNGAYWALSYEAAYFALFACVFYMRGWLRMGTVILCCAVVGINILLLLPCWLIGVWLYHKSAAATHRLDPIILMLLPVGLYIIAHTIALPDMLNDLTIYFVSAEGFLQLRFSGSAAWNTFLALLIAAHLLAAHKWFSDDAAQDHALAWPIRKLAQSSFSIYLFHLPVMNVAKPVLSTHVPVLNNDVGLLSVTIGICLLFAVFFEHTLPWQRKVLRHLFVDRGGSDAERAP